MVMKCYSNLFKKIQPDQLITYMSKIVEKLHKENKSPLKIQIVYTISIYKIYLCTDNQMIQISKEVIKLKITKNLVSLTQIYINAKMLELNSN